MDTVPPVIPQMPSSGPVKKNAHAQFVVYAVVGVAALLLILIVASVVSKPGPVVEQIPVAKQSSGTYSQAELDAAMNTPLPADQVVTYDEKELDAAMNTPLPPEEVKTYSPEELQAAMGKTQ